MRILFCSHYAGLGGANFSLLNLYNCLKKNKEFYGIVLLPEEGPFTKVLKDNGIEYIVGGYYDWVVDKDKKSLPLVGNCKNYFKNRLAALKIIKFLERKMIDIVHTNDSLTIVGVYIASALGIPHIWHFREFLTDDYNLKFRYCNWYVKRMIAKSSGVICISKEIMHHFMPYFGKTSCNLIYNGIPIESNKGLGEKYNDFTIFFAGGDNNEKGYNLLRPIIKDLIENDIRIIIAGEIRNQENKIELRGLYPLVMCLGFTNEISIYRSRSHLSLVLSKREAFGRVTVESMMEGTLLVATNSGANSEIIDNGKNGFILRQNDSLTLLNTILYIKENYRNLRFMEKDAYDYALNNFSIDRVANEVMEIYKSIMENGGYGNNITKSGRASV